MLPKSSRIVSLVIKCHMAYRKCSHCNISKEQRSRNYSYVKRKNGKYGWNAVCRKCVSIYNRDYHESNKEKIIERKKEYYQENLDSIKEYHKKYRQENKESRREYNRSYRIKRMKNDSSYKLRKLISSSIYRGLKKNGSSKNGKSISDYLPYSINDLKKHLESQFEPWMTWENHGVYDPNTWDDNDSSTWTWNIDHIVPHCNFYYTSMEDDDFQICWALENLRPLSSKINIQEQHYR